MRVYLQHLDHSPRDGYRVYAERLAAHNCRFASELHNTTSAAQRRAAVQQLKDYESDLRALIVEPAADARVQGSAWIVTRCGLVGSAVGKSFSAATNIAGSIRSDVARRAFVAGACPS